MELIQEHVEASLELGNEAFSVLEQACQTRLKSRSLSAEPTSPSEGDAYVLTSSPTGTNWAGHAGDLAVYYGGWIFLDAENITGFRAWVDDESAIVVINDTSGALIGAGNLTTITFQGDPPSTYKIPVFISTGLIEIDSVRVGLRGPVGANVDVNIRYVLDMADAGQSITSGNVNLSDQAGNQVIGLSAQQTLNQNYWYYIEFGTVNSGPLDSLTLSFEYHQDVA